MAYCKVFTSHNAGGALRYGEHEKDVERGGVNCPADTQTAMMLFKADRIMWDKTDGIQAHIIVQSFDEDISKKDANKIGCELAEKYAPGHKAMVYTHDQGKGGKVHNHIVIESINPETGKKLDTSRELFTVREMSDGLCLEHGLSVIEPEKARQDERFSMAERALEEKGEKPWKSEMREKVQEAFFAAHDIDSFKVELKERGIDVSERNRTYQDKQKELDFTFADQDGHKCRAHKLGDIYTRREVLEAYKVREQEQAKEKEREPERTPEPPKPERDVVTETLLSTFERQTERTDGIREQREAEKQAEIQKEQEKKAMIEAMEKSAAEARALENARYHSQSHEYSIGGR